MRYLPLLLFTLLFSCKNESSPALPTPTAPAAPAHDLISSPDAAVPLTAFNFSDSTLLLPDYSLSPQAKFVIQTVVPHAENERLNELINKTIAAMMDEEQIGTKVSNLPQALHDITRTTLYNYGKQNIDSTEIGNSPHMYTLDLEYKTEVLHNANGVLSIVTGNYVYAGGAHPNYAARYESFDAQTASRLSISELFLETSIEGLTQMINENIDRENLYEQEDIVPPTENFALTNKGLIFNYPPYEIGPYAAGEFEITLPYPGLTALLTERGQELVKGFK
jgi:hypothetical protein